MKTTKEWNPNWSNQNYSKGRKIISPKKESRFFPQIKIDGNWIYCIPVRKPYGQKTIEDCEDLINSLEQDDMKRGKMMQYRIKEEEV